MADYTRGSNVNLDTTTAMFAGQITGLTAGEDLLIAAPCYIKSSDGKAYLATAASANEAAELIGFAARSAKSGQPVTLVRVNARFMYGTGFTPGDDLYVSGSVAGALASGSATGCTTPVGRFISATDFIVTRSA